MKIRNGFVSNSSSSSFIISNKYDKEEVIKFVKKVLIRTTEKKIEEVNKERIFSNWEEYIENLRQDITDEILNQEINVDFVKDIDWDLSEWHDMSEINENDLVLYDNSDNYINWITEEILDKFDVKSYCTHMG